MSTSTGGRSANSGRISTSSSLVIRLNLSRTGRHQASRLRSERDSMLRFIERLRNLRLIVDTEKRLGNFGRPLDRLPLLTTSKEETSRSFVFAERGDGLTF